VYPPCMHFVGGGFVGVVVLLVGFFGYPPGAPCVFTPLAPRFTTGEPSWK
jgi:hypothetical protein